ncbi:MAG: hypothetical protein M4579_007049 [Chaenotheca gracillima]|nr:MAG: hypothetical protein M4579_007049 [Chaenotheca gracillima]
MKDFLTPSKIGLLALISLYCENVVPVTSTVPILSFLISHVLPKDASSTTTSQVNPAAKAGGPMIPLEEFERVLSVLPSASGFPGRSVWDWHAEKMWSINSLDALFAFFEEINKYLPKTAADIQREDDQGIVRWPGPENRVFLSRSSPLGAFIRRAQLAFSRMQIHDSVALWKRLILYRQSSLPDRRRRHSAATDLSFDAVLGDMNLGWDDNLTNTLYGDLLDGDAEPASLTSMDEIERLLEFQVEKMQKMGTRVPEELRDRFRNFLSGDTPAPNLSHYVKFMAGWGLPVFGDNIPLVFENILKSSHLNLTKNMTNGVAAQMSMQSSLWARLGVTHLAWSHCEIFDECYSEQATLHDALKMTCRSASILVQKGCYDEGLAKMESVDRECLRTLKNYQLWTVFTGLFRLKRELFRNNLEAAEYLLGQLRSPDIQDPDTHFEFEVLYIDYLTRRASYAEALSHLETLASSLKDEDRDIYLRVRLLTLKTFLLDKCGFAPKGFSIAVRAASIAWRARLMPVLWEALCAVSVVLIQLKEFEAAAKVLNAIMPQYLKTDYGALKILECEDVSLSALAYSLLVDAHMGQAGEAEAESPRRIERLTRASELTDCAFGEYSRIEEVQKQCEMMSKKATIMHLMNEYVLANDYAAKYLELRKGLVHGIL